MLFFGSTALALLIAALFHRSVADIVTTGLLSGGSLTAAYLTWATFAGIPSLGDVADVLAAEVARQWEAEAVKLELDKPYPLSVSWDTDPSIADSWNIVVQMATERAGGPLPPPSYTWAAGPEALVGEGAALVGVLAGIPTGRLVVLGGAGAGKTVLMIRLVLGMLKHRAPGAPVPVLCPVASWNPKTQELFDWLSGMLPFDHPSLAARAPLGGGTCIEVLLREGMIVPILDGLDEIPAKYHIRAIGKLNDGMWAGARLVVTCRTDEYERAVRRQSGVADPVRGAATIRLLPVAGDAVAGFLRARAGGESAQGRWDDVMEALGTKSAVGQALSSPLMVALASAIYNPRSDETIEELRDPGELCNFTDPAKIEGRLLDAFIPDAYRRGSRNRWRGDDAKRWLVFLARHLTETIKSTDFAWWELQKSVPDSGRIAGRISQGLVCGRFFVAWLGVVAAVVAGLITGAAVGPTGGFLTGLGGGLAVWLVEGALGVLPVAFPIWAAVSLAAGIAGGMVGGLLGGTVAGLAVGFAFGVTVGQLRSRVDDPRKRLLAETGTLAGAWLTTGVAAGLADGAFAGILVAVAAAGFIAGYARLSIPRETTKAGLLVGLAGGIASGVVTGVIAGIVPALVAGAAVGVIILVRVLLSIQKSSGVSLPGEQFSGAMSPDKNLQLIRRAALIQCCGIMLGSGLAFGLLITAVAGTGPGVFAGIAAGGLIGLACSGIDPVWLSYMLARACLAWRHELPWRLMGFLADARDRGVLRQVGAIYQFRHDELKQRLATRRPQPPAAGYHGPSS
jgi:hypothetical protein